MLAWESQARQIEGSYNSFKFESSKFKGFKFKVFLV